MTDVATNFPPQTYSSSFFLNALGEMLKTVQFTFSGMILVLLQLLALSVLVKSECVDINNPKTRVFQSLLDFQTNKIPFNPTSEKFEGNYVSFINLSMEVLQKNSFISFESNQVAKLFLENHQIGKIEDGAFVSLNCIMHLNLRRNKIDVISKNTFIGLQSLNELDLSENKIKELPDYVFNFTKRIKVLNITRNHLKIVHPDSLYNLFLLEELDMSYNYLHQIVPEVFQYSKNLVNLQLGSNQLVDLDFEKWNNLHQLKVLNVSNNALISVDFSYTFSFGSTLTELYLDENYLTKINNIGLRTNLPVLKLIDISENPWACSDLVSVLKVLNDSRINYTGHSVTKPSINGIACNRSFEVYQSYKWTEPPIEAELGGVNTSNSRINLNASSGVSIDSTDLQILGAITTLKILTICFFTIVVLFIFVDIFMRIGCCNFIREHRHTITDDVDNISLLRSRI